MPRFVWSELRHRRGRAATLGLGVLVAAMSFTLLTSAAQTSQLRVTGDISRNFRGAYDILVRPPGSFTPLERGQGLIQDNYLSGIFGGITFKQYQQIKSIPGVEIAAPIANIGYILPFKEIAIPINRFLSNDPTQLYRLRFTWIANGGLSQYPDSAQYVYVSARDRFASQGNGAVAEVFPDGDTANPCLPFSLSRPTGWGPFSMNAQTAMFCFSRRTPKLQWPVLDVGPLPDDEVGVYAFVSFPVLLAAIDPVQENRLVGLSNSIVSGRMLAPGDRPTVEVQPPGAKFRVVPFVASSRTFLNEQLRVSVDRLSLPDEKTLYRGLSSETGAFHFVSRLSGKPVGAERFALHRIYTSYLNQLGPSAARLHTNYNQYWTTSPSSYRAIGDGRFEALTTHNPPSLYGGGYGEGWAPQELRDTQFRALSDYRGSEQFGARGVYDIPEFRVVGRFDPAELPGFSQLSSVPLETYYPPRVLPGDQAARSALGDEPLLPTMNIGGYVSQPPLMLTTLRGLRTFTNPDYFEGASRRAPISVIRIRVSGVTGPDPASRERIKAVAQAIHDRTGLAVDITAGSSPHPLLIDLPAGKYGQPALTVREGWVEKGVAVAFLDALDRKSLALFVLIVMICAFFLGNGALASVRSRRTELGTLLCLGWSRAKIFSAVLGELFLVGLIAGLLGTGLGALLVAAFSLKMPLIRTLLVVPVAITLALVAGFVPAWRGSGGSPLDAVHPAVSERGRVHRIGRVASMAMNNVRRVPARTALGAGALLVGVAALTAVIAINRAFQGTLVGTVLGRFVSLRVRGVDLLSVVLTVALGGLSVADVLFLNVRERDAELVTLRTVGWERRHLRTLIVLEGISMGTLGSLAGVAIGVAVVSFIRGIPISSIGFAAALAAGSGILVAALGSLLPLAVVDRLTPPTVLAEE